MKDILLFFSSSYIITFVLKGSSCNHLIFGDPLKYAHSHFWFLKTQCYVFSLTQINNMVNKLAYFLNILEYLTYRIVFSLNYCSKTEQG